MAETGPYPVFISTLLISGNATCGHEVIIREKP